MVLGWYSAKLGNTGLACGQDPSKTRQSFFNLCDDLDPSNVNPDNHIDNDKLAHRAMAFIERNQSEHFATFVLFGMPDWAGHFCRLDESGGNSGYLASVSTTPAEGASGCSHLEDEKPDIFWGYGTDYWTGQIMDYLEELGLADDALIVVTSDHGFPARGRSHALRYPHVFLVASKPIEQVGWANAYSIVPSILRHMESRGDE